MESNRHTSLKTILPLLPPPIVYMFPDVGLITDVCPNRAGGDVGVFTRVHIFNDIVIGANEGLPAGACDGRVIGATEGLPAGVCGARVTGANEGETDGFNDDMIGDVDGSVVGLRDGFEDGAIDGPEEGKVAGEVLGPINFN